MLYPRAPHSAAACPLGLSLSSSPPTLDSSGSASLARRRRRLSRAARSGGGASSDRVSGGGGGTSESARIPPSLSCSQISCLLLASSALLGFELSLALSSPFPLSGWKPTHRELLSLVLVAKLCPGAPVGISAPVVWLGEIRVGAGGGEITPVVVHHTITSLFKKLVELLSSSASLVWLGALE